jgi:hypothetical protein
VEPRSRHPLEEYKIICEMMRGYALLRFYQMALLLGTAGAVLTAIASDAVQRQPILVVLLKLVGLLIGAVFLIMDFRASSYWHALRARANELAAELGFMAFPVREWWNPLTTTGASLVMHAFLVLAWLYALLFVQPA